MQTKIFQNLDHAAAQYTYNSMDHDAAAGPCHISIALYTPFAFIYDE